MRDGAARALRAATLAALLGGCAGSAGEPAAAVEDTGVAVDEPTPWERADDTAAPDQAIALLEEGLAAGVGALGAVDAAALLQGYADALAKGTRDCPGTYPAVGVTMAWSNTCTTAEGWSFDGRAQAAWMANATVDGQAYAPYGEFINTATLAHPGGAALSMDGRGTHLAFTEGATATLAVSLQGSFGYTGTGEEGWMEPGWLGGAPSVALAVERTDAGEVQSASFEGGIARSTGLPDGILGIRAEALRLDWDGSCAATGALVLLGDAGQRYRFELPEAGGCAPCGPLLRGAEAVGEACVDLSGLVGWTERPW